MRRNVWVCLSVGAIVLVGKPVRGEEVSLSSAPLMGAATGMVPAPDEPFVNPFGTKKPRIVSGFGKRTIKDQPAPEVHEGVDYAALPGSVVRAARSGKVIFAGYSKMYVSRADKTEQNRFVIIRHLDGKSSRYVHLSALRVRPGQEVTSGQPIAVLAESDEWSEPVLHFEIRDVQGQAVDPKTLVEPVKKP